MKIAVLGGGNAAQALAGDLALAGHDVTIAEVPAFAQNLMAIQAAGGLRVEGNPPLGGSPGFAKAAATTDVAAAVRGAEQVWIAVPGYGQDAFFESLVAAAEAGQTIVIMPGKFGSLSLRARFDAERPGLPVYVCEVESFIYAARLRGPGVPWIKSSKSRMRLAALPAADTVAALANVAKVFGTRFVAAANVLEAGFSQPGIIMHPITTLMNASRIEQMAPYRNAFYDVTPSIGRVMEVVDAERVRVGEALGLGGVGLVETLSRFYGVDPSLDVYNAIRGVKGYATQTAPDSLMNRYVHEDVPYGLVPISELGRLVGVATPGMDASIHLASMANGIDYRAEGRTLPKMGLERFRGSVAALRAYLNS